MNHTNSPLVSVIIPLFNAEKFLEPCVSCLTEQSFALFEAIFVDDYSTDNSVEILTNLTAHDNRFIVATNSGPKGVSAARNTGVNLSRGEYLYFLDVDDRLQNHTLKFFADEAAGPHELICTTYYKKLDDGPIHEFNHEIENHRDLSTVEIFDYVQKYIKTPYKYTLFVHCWNKLYRSEIIKNNALTFDTELSQLEDVNFNFRYLQHVKSAKFLQGGGYIHLLRSNEDNASKFSGFGNEPVSKCQLALKSVYDYLRTREQVSHEQAEALSDHLFSTVSIMFFYRMVRRLVSAPDYRTFKQVLSWVGSKQLKRSIANYEVQKGESSLLKVFIKYTQFDNDL